MMDPQAQMDAAVTRLVAAVDKEAMVPPVVQIRGALAFGIAAGDLPPGARLPSVRGLAARLGVSPVTISAVYAGLQEAGHIEGRHGSGTYVSARRQPSGGEARHARLERDMAQLLADGAALGLSAEDLAARLTMIAAAPAPAPGRPLTLVMLGNFRSATEAYAAALRPHLPPGDQVLAVPLTELTPQIQSLADLVIAPRTLLSEARALFPRAPVQGVTLALSPATSEALAGVSPDARVVAVSYFPDFLAVMKAGIRRYAPHLRDPRVLTRDDPMLAETLRAAEVVVYATGMDYLRGALAPGAQSFEYRHTPEPASIAEDLLPALEACRHNRKGRPDADP